MGYLKSSFPEIICKRINSLLRTWRADKQVIEETGWPQSVLAPWIASESHWIVTLAPRLSPLCLKRSWQLRPLEGLTNVEWEGTLTPAEHFISNNKAPSVLQAWSVLHEYCK